ncbi:hypothetical protein OCE55_24875 [Bacillus paranthracis]|uniref:hypothetical protein n=1 Tax=Bacillus cereus group TaxID=86661 RepID=UPI001F59B466|nr:MULTISPECIES: hypothetical protein [Bacillus cereus group]MCU5391252.1 hypothetical protein [Bacillus paranthracis]
MNKKRYTLTYYEEHKKESTLYDIAEKDFYNAELEALKKLAEVKNLDYKRKDKITLTNNKTKAVYTANWPKTSPVTDQKRRFYLRNFVYNNGKKQKNENVWLKDIFSIELVLILLIASIISVIVFNITPSLSNTKLKSVADFIFLVFLVMTQLLKEFLYEKIRDTFNNLRVMSLHILAFELALSFSTFTTIYAATNGGKLPMSEESKWFTEFYLIGLVVLAIFIIIRVNKDTKLISNRENFHNHNK